MDKYNGEGIQPIAEAKEEDALEQPKSSSSDEYGDPDFDSEMVEALDITQRELGLADDEAGGVELPMEALPDDRPPAPSSHTAPAEEHTAIGSDDEFGFDDDDDFAADLEQVASLYDTQPPEAEPAVQEVRDHAPSNPAPPVITIEDDSDDYGDDGLDEDDFVAAEVAATQAVNGQHPVCNSSNYTLQ